MELEEAEATYAKAEEQIKKWSPRAAEGSSFARQQVELWTETSTRIHGVYQEGRVRDE